MHQSHDFVTDRLLVNFSIEGLPVHAAINTFVTIIIKKFSAQVVSDGYTTINLDNL